MTLLHSILRKTPKNLPSLINSLRNISGTQNRILSEKLKGPDEGIVVMSFNKPENKNALNQKFANDINEAIYKVSIDSDARVLLLRSLVPGAFCAGADLKYRITLPPEEVAPASAFLRSMTDKIHNLPIPVIAAMDGLALGGGLEIALACDIRVASSEAKMGLVETRLAIIPGAGGTQRLPRLINPSIAKELIFTARVIDANTAYNLGIVNHVVQQNESGDAAYVKSLEIAREILPNGPVGVQMAKQAINKGTEVDLKTGLTIEGACYSKVIPTKDRIEGLQAFKEKRKPKYTGR